MDQLLPFALFAFVASITPGPTNILVLSHSSRFGLATTVPIILGACAAAALLVLLVGTGLGDLLARHATVQTALSWAGIAWLSWMAWQIFSAPAQAIDPDRPVEGPRLGLAGAAGLQLVNPKTWMMALAVVSVFAGAEADRTVRVLWLSLAFFAISIPCMTVWAYLGLGAARFCRSAVAMGRFNRVMAVMLLVSAWLTLVM
ncbi:MULTISPECIES: LysE family translocator [Pseudomonas]|jgi:threonine/homoserine/homoserine lactone efflux protein|uniref:LysE family translocator n=1 Tax=Pseudomonas bijieensis TaxID=2681983 RepID=A0A6N1C9D0_9PSED|nr:MULTISPECIES: LysE family translocator [Pseudomonas]AXP03436.1 LysE family translocator [Pseudomonas fluorescens]MCD9116736.1 LysE family translocator [Pseudomonas bijieensis]PWJ35211.1 threonine/homoserine/homoserine lactone efflux protein [Pseudomonas sp. 43mfcvi1.1]QKS80882.1 LysE family translocator [Pseudomonas bijieensis]UQI28608.1 LysE family translocator [Pseudomonas bijieensis]